MRPCILHIDMDAFYASVEQLRHPELRGKPVIVGGDGRRGVVAAASYEARRFGVRSAMPAGEARRLCPNGVFLPPDFATYRAASSQVFAVLGRFTPLIEPLSLDEAFLDMSGNPQARSDPEGLAVQLKAEVHSATGLTASVGVSTCKVVSKVASDLRKPDGLVVVDAGKEEAFLRPLPLRALPGLGPAAEKKLEGLGLRTVGELAALPVEVLAARLGKLGPVLHEMAHGVDGCAVVLPATPKSISREVTFEVDVRDRTELLLTARSLAQDVARSLRR